MRSDHTLQLKKKKSLKISKLMKCPAYLQFELLWGKRAHTRLKTVFQYHKEPNV